MTSDQLGLFEEAEARPRFAPLTFVGVCHHCGAEAHVPHDDLATGEHLDPGAPWSGVLWVSITLKAHERECPARPGDRTVLPLVT